MNIISRLLEKRGIKDVSELSVEEKATFKTWEAILSKEQLTLEDVKKFCESQVVVIESKWKDLNETNQKKAELIPYHTVYKTLLQAIDAPKSAREMLEQQLTQLLN